jgi:D-proline reductase (dithiol) PrdB
MTEVDSPDRTAKDLASDEQLRPGLWETINDRYPGAMIVKNDFVPLAYARRPLHEARVTLVSSCGVHLKSEHAMDVCHPFGDFTFRRVPSDATSDGLIIHQLKYPHDDADLDINVIFPIERLQEMVAQKVIGSTTPNFFSFIGYNMDPGRFDRTVAAEIAREVCHRELADIALLAPA